MSRKKNREKRKTTRGRRRKKQRKRKEKKRKEKSKEKKKKKRICTNGLTIDKLDNLSKLVFSCQRVWSFSSFFFFFKIKSSSRQRTFLDGFFFSYIWKKERRTSMSMKTNDFFPPPSGSPSCWRRWLVIEKWTQWNDSFFWLDKLKTNNTAGRWDLLKNIESWFLFIYLFIEEKTTLRKWFNIDCADHCSLVCLVRPMRKFVQIKRKTRVFPFSLPFCLLNQSAKAKAEWPFSRDVQSLMN